MSLRPPQLARLFVAFAAAACFSPDIPDGVVPCGPEGECPSGQTCVAEVCHKPGGAAPDASLAVDATPVDAALPADAARDGSPADAALDAGAPDGTPTATVRVTFRGTGAGTVDVGGTPCATSCAPTFSVGEVITLVAAPDASSIFAGWAGACDGTDRCVLTVPPAGADVTVTFTAASTFVELRVTVVGPGSVTVAPASPSCGSDCYTLGAGATVTLTAAADPGFSVIGWGGGGCPTTGGDPCSFTIDADTMVVARFCSFNEVADPTAGKDTNAGTCNQPYASLTQALSVATPGDLVLARTGQYDDTLESFPLVVPEAVSLVGDFNLELGRPSVSGGGPVVGTSLQAAVVVAKGAAVTGIDIVDPLGAGVVLAGAGATVRDCTIDSCATDGVYVADAPGAVVLGNTIRNQAQGSGVFISAGGPGTLLQQNDIQANSFGVQTSADADLGGGPAGSLGGNTLSCNLEADLSATTDTGTLSVSADDNLWEHVPPVEGCMSPTDVCASGADVTLDGAGLAPPCVM